MKRALIVLCLIASPLLAQEQAASSDELAKAVFFGRKFFDLKEYASSYEQFAKAAAMQPDNPALLYDVALVLAKAGRYAEAQAKVDRYVQLYPNGAEKALVANLQLELAFQRELQKKRQADQDYTELFTRGRFLYAKNDLDAALQAFRQAEQQRPNDAAAVFNEAVIFEKLGDLAKANERFHRYEELEPDPDSKSSANQRILGIESELEDMKTKIVCAFCGFRLPIGAAWCPHCWHGPYLTSAPQWSSRPCIDGASATRATYYADDRFAKNDALPCISQGGTLLDSLRYTPARQKAIQDARKAEGWTYNGEIIQGQRDQLQFVQGPEYLQRVVAANGDVLTYSAHKSGAAWLLDREDVVIDGQKYTSRYTFDEKNRIAQQQVEYQNGAACNHLIAMTADYVYANDALVQAKIAGGYDGWTIEGAPRVDWIAQAAYTYDANARLAKEELAVTSFTKTYKQKASGKLRDEVNNLYPAMRVGRPIENAIRYGDRCGMTGTTVLGNAIDLRPFYALSPNIAMQLPLGVTKAVVSINYPDSYRVR